METFKFRWNLAIALVAWVFILVCYQAGLTYWPEFTFIHTFIPPATLIVTLAPLSVEQWVKSKWFEPGLAIWAGLSTPGTYIVVRWLTGFGPHCDKVSVIGGVVVFSAILARWSVVSFYHRSVQRSAV